MNSASAHPVDDLAHRDAPGAPTHRAAAHAAEIATNTAVQTVVPGRPREVRRARQVISLTVVQVEELRRVQ
jgi:hypothetical protein